MPDLERGTVRPASDDYAFNAEYEDRGKLAPCPGCGDAPDHRIDDQKCVANRVHAVRQARKAQEELLALERERRNDDLERERRLRELERYMVD